MKAFWAVFALALAPGTAHPDACGYVKNTLWPKAPNRELESYPEEARSQLIGTTWKRSKEKTTFEGGDIWWQSEATFDFDNDGKVDRVFLSNLSSIYLWGSVILVRYGTSAEGFVAKSSGLNDGWLLPCQLGPNRLAVEECPPLSQRGDETELSIRTKNGSISTFPARYSQVIPFVFGGQTYLAVQTTYGKDGERGIGVLKPEPHRSFKALCVVRGNAIIPAAK
jgi:hypothetical protein